PPPRRRRGRASVRCREANADSPHGVQVFRCRRALAELSSEPVEVYVDRLVFAHRWLSPYLLQQLPARNTPTRTRRQVGEQVELFAGQGELALVEVGLPLGEVHLQAAGFQDTR